MTDSPVTIRVEISVDVEPHDTTESLARKGWKAIRELQAPVVEVVFTSGTHTVDFEATLARSPEFGNPDRYATCGCDMGEVCEHCGTFLSTGHKDDCPRAL